MRCKTGPRRLNASGVGELHRNHPAHHRPTPFPGTSRRIAGLTMSLVIPKPGILSHWTELVGFRAPRPRRLLSDLVPSSEASSGGELASHDLCSSGYWLQPRRILHGISSIDLVPRWIVQASRSALETSCLSNCSAGSSEHRRGSIIDALFHRRTRARVFLNDGGFTQCSVERLTGVGKILRLRQRSMSLALCASNSSG